MMRIVIGGTLIALCTAVATAQTTPPGKGTPSVTPGGPTLPSGKKQTTPAPGGAGQTVTPSSPRLVMPNQSLAITGGGTINAVFDSNAKTYRVNLKDGVYKTDNGGAIRVRGGVIVWDAFGAVERLRRSGGTAEAPITLA